MLMVTQRTAERMVVIIDLIAILYMYMEGKFLNIVTPSNLRKFHLC